MKYVTMLLLLMVVGCETVQSESGVEGVTTRTLIDSGVIDSYDDLTPGQKTETFESESGSTVHPYYPGSVACRAVNNGHRDCQ